MFVASNYTPNKIKSYLQNMDDVGNFIYNGLDGIHSNLDSTT